MSHKKVDILVKGFFDGASGYSRCAINIVHSLIRTGKKIGVHNYSSEFGYNTNIVDELCKNLVVDKGTISPVILHIATPSHVRYESNSFNIVYTMFELDKIPSSDIYKNSYYLDWVSILNKADLVVTPTKFCKDIFTSSGVTSPIEHIFIPLDTSLSYPSLDLPSPKNKLKILTVAQWVKRKALEELLNSILIANKEIDLYLKTFVSKQAKKKSIKVISLIKLIAFSFHSKSNSNIYPIMDNYSYKDMRALYALTDVYMTLSRGEGFGLPIVEAMLQETPIIAPIHSSIKDLVSKDDPFVFPVEYIEDYAFGYFECPFVCPTMKWCNPVLTSAVDQINKVFEASKEEVLHKGEKINKLKYLGKLARKHIKDKVTFNQVAKEWNVLLDKYSTKIQEKEICHMQ